MGLSRFSAHRRETSARICLKSAARLRSVGIVRSVVFNTTLRAEAARLSCAAVECLSDQALEERCGLASGCGSCTAAASRHSSTTWAGSPSFIDPNTGGRVEVELVVGMLGASSLTYAEATLTQRVPDSLGSHVRMFESFGREPQLVHGGRAERGSAHRRQ